MFSNAGLPHGWCFLWQPGLLWLHVVSDSLIALAYLAIPFTLVRIVRGRRDIPFNGILLCFGGFIVACGLTHAMDVYTLWHPVYWLSGWLKALTAVVSLSTLALLIHLTPAILKFPSSTDVQRLNSRLNSVLESTSDGVMTINFDWRIIYLNRQALETNAGRNLLDQPFWDVFSTTLGTVAEEQLRKCMHERVKTDYEIYYDLYSEWFRVHAYPSTDGLSVFFSNISSQKTLEQKLEQERFLKEKRIEALSLLAGGLAHEINNPLSIIYARASDLEEIAAEADTVPSPLVISASGSILRTADRAIRILRGLQGFAREGSKDPMQPASLEQIAEQAIELVQGRFQQHNVAIELSMLASVPDVVCREVQIGQIIVNLLNNAFDAIDSSQSNARWVLVRIYLHDSHAAIDVIDSGPGVDQASRAHLMEPFFTTKPVGAGMGVGLSLSRAIAQDHRGSLALTDHDGHTCFRLLLPLAQPPAA